MITPSLKSSHKSMTVGAHRGAHEIKLVRTIAFQSTTKFLRNSRWFLCSLEFLTDKFGNLSLQEPKLSEVIGSGTGHLPPALDQVGVIDEAQLGLSSLGETDADSMEDRADHTLAT
jgi:hypothetical protein